MGQTWHTRPVLLRGRLLQDFARFPAEPRGVRHVEPLDDHGGGPAAPHEADLGDGQHYGSMQSKLFQRRQHVLARVLRQQRQRVGSFCRSACAFHFDDSGAVRQSWCTNR